MTNSLRIAALAIALIGTPAALADAIPGPQELNAAQTLIVGVWQQTEQAPGRDHAQTRTTYIFDQAHYTRVDLHLIAMSNASDSFTQSGTWTGVATGDNAFALTLTPTGGPEGVIDIIVTGPKAIAMQLWPGNQQQVKFERIFP